MEAIREQLKLSSQQYNLYTKNVVVLQNNLISLTDKVFPGVNELFSSPDHADGSQKWVDFVMTVRHCECINLINETAFTERYCKWCKRKGYHFSVSKAADLYIDREIIDKIIPLEEWVGVISRTTQRGRTTICPLI